MSLPDLYRDSELTAQGLVLFRGNKRPVTLFDC